MQATFSNLTPSGAAIVLRDAIRDLSRVELSGQLAAICRRTARELDARLSDSSADAPTLAAMGPRRKGVPLVAMLMRSPGADPYRTAKLLLRAIEWDDE